MAKKKFEVTLECDVEMPTHVIAKCGRAGTLKLPIEQIAPVHLRRIGRAITDKLLSDSSKYQAKRRARR